MRVHHLSCGTMCPFGGGLFDGSATPLFGRARLVCHVLLVETDAHGLVLVDSGLGRQDMRHASERLGRAFVAAMAPELDEALTAIRQIEALGLDPAAVKHIVLTHMDLDHAGALGDFPGATVHVTLAEHTAATRRPTLLEQERYRPIQWAHGARFETYDPEGEPWLGFAAVRDLRGLPPEILMIPLSGHSRGHSAVAVKSGERWLLHAGDAYFHGDEMDVAAPRCPRGLTLFQRVVAIDAREMRANKARLRELVRDHSAEVDVFCAHDETELLRMQRG